MHNIAGQIGKVGIDLQHIVNMINVKRCVNFKIKPEIGINDKDAVYKREPRIHGKGGQLARMDRQSKILLGTFKTFCCTSKNNKE